MKHSFKILILFTIFTLFACGKKEIKDTEATTTPKTGQQYEENPIDSPMAANDFTIESNDQMKYSTSELKATAGKITLTLKHVGTMAKAVMGHNLVILQPETDLSDFALKAADSKNTDYIPASEKAKVIAHTKLIGGGESDTIEFTIDKKGTYDFICSFPGHAAIMKGKLIVE